jgi:phage baseplate assembly protein W
MASITFNGFKKNEITTNRYLYSDLQLDIANPVVRDLKSSYDEAAIKTSLVTLFNTLPGQNLLNPEYGLNLMQFLFLPTSNTVGRTIGERILKNINVYEPRVKVQNIDVQVNPDEQIYIITLSMLIPALNQQIRVDGTLDKTGFTLLR